MMPGCGNMDTDPLTQKTSTGIYRSGLVSSGLGLNAARRIFTEILEMAPLSKIV